MVAAFFDVDGTLTRTNVIVPLAWYQRAHLSRWRYRFWLTGILMRAPFYWLIDRFDRAAFVRLFYRRYAGLPVEQVRRWHREHFTTTLLPLIRQDALTCVRRHQEQGHRIVFVTGNLDFVLSPLAEWLGADLLAASLEERDGLFTGRLASSPMVGKAKAEAALRYAQRHGIVLRESYAYGDSISDAFLLALVGHPIAVNPDRPLRRLACRNGWRIVAWR
ncbi:MAG: hypothetical protein SLRJCFUN_002163 [Candidatus Fervidibacter sp.]